MESSNSSNSSNSSIEIVFDNDDPCVVVVVTEEEICNAEQQISCAAAGSSDDDTKKDSTTNQTDVVADVVAQEPPVAWMHPENDDGAVSATAVSSLLQQLPMTIDSLVSAKAAIASRSAVSSVPSLNNPFPLQQPLRNEDTERMRHQSVVVAKREARCREHLLAETTAIETASVDDDTAIIPQDAMLEQGHGPTSSIPAEVVSESDTTTALQLSLTTERERFIQEVRQRITAEVVPAELVQVSHSPDPVDDDDEHHKRRLHYRYCWQALVFLVLIGIVVGALVGGANNRPKSPIVPTTLTPSAVPTTAAAALVPTMTPTVILPNGKRAFTTTAQLYDAVDAYEAALQSNGSAEKSMVAKTYGYPMGTWDVSRLTDFSRVFNKDRTERLDPTAPIKGFIALDADLSDWNVSNAITMNGMFAGANQFVGTGLEHWNVGKVSDFSFVFLRAQAFGGNLSLWNTSSATTMEGMFAYAENFNGDLTQWDVSRVRTMALAFYFAEAFQGGDLTRWNTSQVGSMVKMFNEAASFNGNVSTWDVRNVYTMVAMVRTNAKSVGIPRAKQTQMVQQYVSFLMRGDSTVTSLVGPWARYAI
jgi:Mycoplasma protein of unknown function, DUF285